MRYDDGIPESPAERVARARRRRVRLNRRRALLLSGVRARKTLRIKDVARLAKGRRLVCVETRQRFMSFSDAADWCECCRTSICNAVYKGNAAKGFHFRPVNTPPGPLSPARDRPVRCRQTGEVFGSLSEATDWLITHKQVRAQVRGSVEPWRAIYTRLERSLVPKAIGGFEFELVPARAESA